jgi:PhnB protein
MVKPVPDGYHTLTPYLVVPDAEVMIQFLQDVLGATLIERHDGPDGTLMHGEFQIGDSKLMMGQSSAKFTPKQQSTYVYVEDVDKVFQRAVTAKAKVLMPVADQYYGDRSCGFEDPAGNWWWVGTHIEDVSREEIERRHLAAQTAQSK